MNLNRKTVNIIRYILEDLIPPALRDSRLFLPLMHFVFKQNTEKFIAFRPSLLSMTEQDYTWYYTTMKPVMGETDLNQACIEQITKDVVGDNILDVGCGRGFLINHLAKAHPQVNCVGVDIDPPASGSFLPNVSLKKGWVERLPLEDKSFDTVSCTHTLEHIQNLFGALAELRRVAKKRLIIVVPREREYKYSFNFHVNFFPYTHSFLNRINPPKGKFFCEVLDGDIYYKEDLS